MEVTQSGIKRAEIQSILDAFGPKHSANPVVDKLRAEYGDGQVVLALDSYLRLMMHELGRHDPKQRDLKWRASILSYNSSNVSQGAVHLHAMGDASEVTKHVLRSHIVQDLVDSFGQAIWLADLFDISLEDLFNAAILRVPEYRMKEGYVLGGLE
jgi:hypothetical protein